MKKILIICFLILFMFGFAYAQEEKDYRTFDKALLFSLNNFQPDEYGGGIGFLFPFKNFELRPLLMFGMSTDKDNLDNDLNWVGEKETASEFGVAVDAIYRLHNSRIRPYFGAGAGVMIGKIKTELDHAEGQKPDIEEESTFTFLVRAILGAEFFFTQDMSLAAEYFLGYASTSTKDTDTTGATGDKIVNKNIFSSMGISAAARIILAIYIK